MEKYALSTKIFDYDSFYKELSEILYHPNNKFCVTHHLPIGKSACGFPIEHYSIGYGPIHVVYMAGAHGNEIIGVSFVLQLMKNLALGRGEFFRFQPDVFTIDFLPLQNPEGYFTTTYALQSIMKTMSLEEKKRFCYDYYVTYRRENEEVQKINQILKECSLDKGDFLKKTIRLFWSSSYKKEVGIEEICSFLIHRFPLEKEALKRKVKKLWKQNFGVKKINTFVKQYQEPFQNLTLDCIPEVDEKHIRLKENLQKLYCNEDFPMCTLANFLANASGVNLNDNNPYYFAILNEQIKKEGMLCANPMYNYPKSQLGPIGSASESFLEFYYAPENKALLTFLDQLGDSCYAFFNLHGTGGQMYVEPFYEVETDKKQPRDFSFYINNRIATEYLKGIEAAYLEKTGKRETYFTMPYPKRVVGFADMLRSNHVGHFLVELSKAGGNPIGPFIEPNYEVTMEANFKAFFYALDAILEVKHLYGESYTLNYNKKGKVFYEVQERKRVRKKDGSK